MMRYPLMMVVVTAGVPTFSFASDLPSFEEAVSAYQQNLLSLFPFTVEWDVVEQQYEPFVKADEIGIPVIKSALETGGVPAEHLEAVRSRLSDMESRVTEKSRKFLLQPKRTKQFLWTDGKRLQYRKPQRTLEGDEELDEGIGVTSLQPLLETCPHVNVISFVPDREPRLRMWAGLATDGKTFTGLIASRNLNRLLERPFPPLGSVRGEWSNTNNRSALDRWTESPAGIQRTDPGDTVRGEDTLIIRQASDGGPDGRIDRTVAWVAHRKGFMPVRIERSYSGGPLSVDPSEGFPLRTFEITEVEGIEQHGEGYYPRSISTTRLGIDPEWRARQDGTIPFEADAPMVPFEKKTEEVTRVRVHRQLDEESIALSFPVGTRYQNDDSDEWYLEGTSKEEFDRQLVAELTGAADIARRRNASFEQPRSTSMLVWVNGAAILLLAAIFGYSRIRSRRKQ